MSRSLLLGFLAGFGLYHDLPDSVRVVAGTGFCGAFTTFSTFTFETIRLIEDGAHAEAARNVAGTVVVGALAADASLALAALI
jgi:CrcB protein